MKINPKYLHQKIPPSTFQRQFANQQLANILTKYMQQQKAIGLAANQVGYASRLFVMQTSRTVRHCFNPEVIESAQEQETSKEGCLSYPKDWILVARPTWINVKYYNYKGDEITERLEGLDARCFLHELDHLDGITMHQRHKELENVHPKS